MRKQVELTDPNSCMSRARPGEMTFVLLGRDVAAPDTIRCRVAERLMRRKNKITDPQITEAMACADAMERERVAAPQVAAPAPEPDFPAHIEHNLSNLRQSVPPVAEHPDTDCINASLQFAPQPPPLDGWPTTREWMEGYREWWVKRLLGTKLREMVDAARAEVKP